MLDIWEIIDLLLIRLSTWDYPLDSEPLSLIKLSHCMIVYLGCDVVVVFYTKLTVKRAEIREGSCFFVRKIKPITWQCCIDLYLPDINLTDGSGLELCRKIRETSEIPILFLIANDTKYKLLLVGQQERQIFSEAEDTLTACLQQQLLKLRNILTAQNQMLAQEKEQNILLLCRWHLENQPFWQTAWLKCSVWKAALSA